jgi:hypothetical protein
MHFAEARSSMPAVSESGGATARSRCTAAYEREEAERAAWSSPGTTVVENEIVVES